VNTSKRPPAIADLAAALSQRVVVQTAPDSTGHKLLIEARGFAPAVIDEFGFEFHNTYWTYITPGSVPRAKAYDSKSHRKYWWPDGKPASPYFHADDLTAAIAAAGGYVWLANGEFSTLAMLSAGIRNVFSLYGETTVPAELVQWLQTQGVKHVLIAPDLDTAGERQLAKHAAILAGSGIEITAYELPPELGEHADIGDLWSRERHLGAHFLMRLLLLPHKTPEPFERAPEPAAAALPEYDGDPGWLALLGAEIVSMLGVRAYYPSGFSKPIRCPMHEHDLHASAGWHGSKHFLHCLACGQSFTAVAVAEKLGIDWRQLLPQRADSVMRGGLPTAISEALLQHDLAIVARVLTALLQAGVKSGELITAKQIQAAGIGLSTAYRALTATIDQWVIFSRIDHVTSLISDRNLCNPGKNKKGRPTASYTMPSLDELARRLGVTARHGDKPLPPSALTSNKAYRVAMYHALIERRPDQYLRQWLGKRLGVSGASTYRYDKPAGVQALPQWTSEELTPASIEGFAESVQGGEKIIDASGKVWPSNRECLQRALNHSQQTTGRAVVTLQKRKPNYYKLAEETKQAIILKFTAPEKMRAAENHVKAAA
jgi:hypothetical protein